MCFTLADVQEQEQQRADGDAGSATLIRDIALYTLARLGLVAAVTTALLLFRVPLLVAVAVAVVAVMPLSLLLFSGLRRRVAAGVAERTEARRARRAELESQLRGERDEE